VRVLAGVAERPAVRRAHADDVEEVRADDLRTEPQRAVVGAPGDARHLHRRDAGERLEPRQVLIVRIGDLAFDPQQAIVRRGAAEAGAEQHPRRQRVDAEVQTGADRDRQRGGGDQQRPPRQRPRGEAQVERERLDPREAELLAVGLASPGDAAEAAQRLVARGGVRGAGRPRRLGEARQVIGDLLVEVAGPAAAAEERAAARAHDAPAGRHVGSQQEASAAARAPSSVFC